MIKVSLRLLKLYEHDARLHEAMQKWTASLSIDQIPKKSLSWAFSKSRGPGGQNVQKVNTKAELQLRISEASWIPAEVREFLIQKKGMVMIIKGDEERSQVGNQEACLRRLLSILKEAARAVAPAPTSQDQQHHVTQLKERAKDVRLGEKRLHSAKKTDRRPPKGGDY